jgi:hypothetical protein
MPNPDQAASLPSRNQTGLSSYLEVRAGRLTQPFPTLGYSSL